MGRIFVFLYGVVGYLLFLATFLYAIGFVNNLLVPKNVNDGVIGSIGLAVAVNVGILLLFAIQHTIMARPSFKRWWTTIIPAPMERSTFVFATCAILGLLFWQWRPLPGVVWDVQTSWLRTLLIAVSLTGFGLVVYATFLIDHFDLFGLRQVVLHLRKRPYTNPAFMERSMYRMVRHPLLLGFLIAFWATPTMTWSHLLFSVVTTGYILFGLTIEERDLVGNHGEDYLEYRRRTPALLPWPRPRRSSTTAAPAVS